MADALTRFMTAIRSVESNGNYKALGPMTSWGRATGAYQFIDATWDNYRGYPSAYLAPKSVQDAKARALMSDYYREFGRWDLVAVAWHAGVGTARAVRRNPAALNGIGDGYTSTGVYVKKVLSRIPSAPRRNGNPHGDPLGGLRPWKVPRNVTGKAGKIVVDPALLTRISKHLTEHLAIVQSAIGRCGAAAADVGKLPKHRKLKHALDEALDDWEGLRRLPRLLARDIGFVVEARSRVVHADDAGNRRERQHIERLIATVHGGPSRTHVARMLRNLYRPDEPRSPRRPPSKPGGIRGVEVGRAWGGAKSVFDQFITPFLRERGLSPGSQKRATDSVPGPAMSDHYEHNKRAYAIDYPTFRGADDARALARALGIHNWRPNTYDTYNVRIDGKEFRVQILWGGGIQHGDHVHVGLRRV